MSGRQQTPGHGDYGCVGNIGDATELSAQDGGLEVVGTELSDGESGVSVPQGLGKAASIKGSCQDFSWVGRVQRQHLQVKGLRSHVAHLNRFRSKENT